MSKSSSIYPQVSINDFKMSTSFIFFFLTNLWGLFGTCSIRWNKKKVQIFFLKRNNYIIFFLYKHLLWNVFLFQGLWYFIQSIISSHCLNVRMEVLFKLLPNITRWSQKLCLRAKWLKKKNLCPLPTLSWVHAVLVEILYLSTFQINLNHPDFLNFSF